MLLQSAVYIFLFTSVSSFRFGNNVCDRDSFYPLKLLSNKHCWRNPDVFSNIEAITTRHGFPLKSYTYVNSDGYIMSLHRIPSKNQSKPAIYLQHGLSSNAAAFVDLNNRSLAFYLASMDYDVWMGNLRGVRDSKRHVNLSSSDSKFWDFNWDTLAAVDIRENLLFISNATGKPGTIIYLGYSTGTTLSYMYASRYPEEAEALLKGIISFAPLASTDGTTQEKVFKIIAPLVSVLTRIFRISAINRDEHLSARISYSVCNMVPWLCRLTIRFFAGPGDQIASQDIPLLTSTSGPSSVSREQLLHTFQILQSKELSMFDYKHDNRKHYGQDHPPVYNLSQIKVPLYLFHGLNDVIATQRNAERLYQEVGSKKKALFKIPEADDKQAFNHLSFMMSRYLDSLLFPKLYQVLTEDLAGENEIKKILDDPSLVNASFIQPEAKGVISHNATHRS